MLFFFFFFQTVFGCLFPPKNSTLRAIWPIWGWECLPTMVHSYWDLTLQWRSRLDRHPSCGAVLSKAACFLLPRSIQEACPERVAGGRQTAETVAALSLYIKEVPSLGCGGVDFSLGPSPNVCPSKKFTEQGWSWGKQSVITDSCLIFKEKWLKVKHITLWTTVFYGNKNPLMWFTCFGILILK